MNYSNYGLCNYYRRFVKGYASVAAPLIYLLRVKAQPFVFTPSARCTFHVLESLLTSTPILDMVDPDLPSRVLADTSDFASSAILEQRYATGWHPVEYFSKHLCSTKTNYSATEHELLGCLLFMQHWRPYLTG